MLQIGTWKISPSINGSSLTTEGSGGRGDDGLGGDSPQGARLCKRCNKSHEGQCTIPHWKRVPPKEETPKSIFKNDKM